VSDQKGKRLPTADRYKFVVSKVQATAHAAAHPDGEYVKWSEYEELQRQLGEANEALAACQSQASGEIGYWKARLECYEYLLTEPGSKTLYWASVAVANAIHAGIGGMIKGTDMERDLRDVLWLRDGEMRDVPKGVTQRDAAREGGK